jgi:hypothetical protein
MADPKVQNDGVKLRDAALAETSNKTNPVRSAYFKYYIHDEVDCCRLQLIGEFTEAEVMDLSGCWNTVSTTLAGRKFVVDLKGLRTTDYAAKQWIIRVAAEGAELRPENFLRDGLAGEKVETRVRSNIRSKLVSLFRRSPAIEV